jgi:magnesium chelatase subunit H
MICMVSAAEVVKLTRLGQFDMDKPASGPMALLKKLRGNKEKAAPGGAAQMKMLRRIPQMLRFIPGTAQDVRAYFMTLQYWLGGSDENMLNLVRHVVDRGADGPRRALRGLVKVTPPVEYPDVGVYHPRMPGRISAEVSALPSPHELQGTVGVLLLRSYLLSNNAGHYDGVIAALEARGLRVIPAFAAGLDSRPAIDKFFVKDGVVAVDAVVSLTGFSLVGGPAYNDAKAAEDVLARLDVPYVAAHPVEFQTLDQWGGSDRGLLPVESTIMVAIPELDGSTSPIVFGGRHLQRLPARLHLQRQRQRTGHAVLPRAGDHAGCPCRQAGGAQARRARAAQGGGRRLQLPAQRGQHRQRCLPVGVRVAVSHADRDEGAGLQRGPAGEHRCLA